MAMGIIMPSRQNDPLTKWSSHCEFTPCSNWHPLVVHVCGKVYQQFRTGWDFFLCSAPFMSTIMSTASFKRNIL